MLVESIAGRIFTQLQSVNLSRTIQVFARRNKLFGHSTTRFTAGSCSSICSGPIMFPVLGLPSGSNEKTVMWNRAVAEAEKAVGCPTSWISLQSLLTEDAFNVARHLRKITGTNHPVLKTVKRLVYDDRSNTQTRGLIVLLVSKIAGHTPKSVEYAEAKSAGVSPKQRCLAEIAEFLYAAYAIHKSILNLDSTIVPNPDMLNELHFGNKISVLSGDYIMASACKSLASIRNCTVVDIMSTALGDLMEAEFYNESDIQGNPLPSAECGIPEWEEHNYLTGATLVANSCKGALVLAGHEPEVQQWGFEIGKNFSLAWQAYIELTPFTNTARYPPGTPFSVASLPVIMHLEKDGSLREYIQSCSDSVLKLDFQKLHSAIIGGEGVAKAVALKDSYVCQAEQFLAKFEPSESSRALSRLLESLTG